MSRLSFRRQNLRPAKAPSAGRSEAPVSLPERLGIPTTLRYPETTLAGMLDQTVARFPSAVAMVYGASSWRYRDLQQQCDRLAGGLAVEGVRAGDRVLLTLPNCPEMVLAFMALQKLGAIPVNAGPLLGADDFKRVCSLAKPQLAFVLDLQWPWFAETLGDQVRRCVTVSLQSYQGVWQRLGYQFKRWHAYRGVNGTPRPIAWEELLRLAPSRPPTVYADPRSLALLQATGGTTGTVKLVELTHQALLANVLQSETWLATRPAQERCLCILPHFHIYGLTTGLITGLFGGHQMVLVTRFNAAETLDLIEQHRPTLFTLVPTIARLLCDELERQQRTARWPFMRFCVSGAASLSQEDAERFERLTGVAIVEGYGLSEAGPVTHVNIPGHARRGSIGLPLPDTLARVVELETGTRDQPPGQPGELLISGPQLMRGYFGDPEQTARTLTRDETGRVWLHTGDIARIDGEGYFHLLGRHRDTINRSGHKIFPGKIEQLLRGHAGVADIAVVGRPDPVHTECVVAVIVRGPTPPAEKVLIEELKTLCRQHLAPYEVPSEFRFVAALPRSPLGKVLKRELRRELAEAAAPHGGSPTPCGGNEEVHP